MSDVFNRYFKKPDEVLEVVPTPESFTKLVDLIISRYNLTYFDAILEICDHYDRDPSSIRQLLSPKLKLELTQEAAKRKLLKDNSFNENRLI